MANIAATVPTNMNITIAEYSNIMRSSYSRGECPGAVHNAVKNNTMKKLPIKTLKMRGLGVNQTDINDAPKKISAMRNNDLDIKSRRYGLIMRGIVYHDCSAVKMKMHKIYD